ncbi:MAG: CCA tRNA nucleotidyltransferase [Candidatus Bathyarchaeota archaeon]|nr:CCA tRNA nucleotidyltransferase [Candidatus Bathyarchaeota archaeon]
METVTQQILAQITPKPHEYTKVNALSRKLEQKIAKICQNEGIPAKIRVEGSVAKDTWLSQNPDIDVFIRLPTSIPRKNLGEVGLRIAKKAAGDAEQLERFAEHPYLEIFLEGYRIDIVPCYDAKPGEWQSATDRTPYHTDYIKTHLDQKLRSEVRLLKQFMQGIGVYGAEIKVGGFSGYLCELLILKYNSFAEAIHVFAEYHQRLVIDLEGFYAGREKELALLFPEPLVIVDPVDKGRNVASAVQPQRLYTLIAAVRAFQKKPSTHFFNPQKTHALPPDIVAKNLKTRGSSTLFLVLPNLSTVPDVLWGQLYRTKRSLRKLLETNDFVVLKDAVWSNERSLNTFVFELKEHTLPNIAKHIGPPLERKAECDKFLSKWVGDNRVVSGPYIEKNRWVVLVSRKIIDASALFREKLVDDGGKKTGVAGLIAKAIKEDFKVLVNEEILKVYVENSDFAVFLTEFLLAKPFWLIAK